MASAESATKAANPIITMFFLEGFMRHLTIKWLFKLHIFDNDLFMMKIRNVTQHARSL
jgi:hypothetical protein